MFEIKLNVLDQRKIVQLLLSKSSIDFNAKNNDNKTAYELQSDREIKRLFEIFITEKNLLNSKSLQRVPIHTTQSENINKMFENIRANYNKSPLGNNINHSNLPHVTLNKTMSDNSSNHYKTSPKVRVFFS